MRRALVAGWNVVAGLAVLFVVGVVVFNLLDRPHDGSPAAPLAFSDFLRELDRGQVADIVVQGGEVRGHFTDGRALATRAPSEGSAVDRAVARGVRVEIGPKE